MASFLGMELSGVHVNDIKNPQKNFPRAVFLASFFIFATMVLGSLAIAFVLPEKNINLVSGVMQVFSNFFEVFGIRALTARSHFNDCHRIDRLHHQLADLSCERPASCS